MGASFCLSVGPYGGFYVRRGYSLRICLGWLSLTFFPQYIDDVLLRATRPKVWKFTADQLGSYLERTGWQRRDIPNFVLYEHHPAYPERQLSYRTDLEQCDDYHDFVVQVLGKLAGLEKQSSFEVYLDITRG